MMTCDTCAVDHVVRNPGGFDLCILKAIKNWTWEEARLNLPLPTVAMTTSLILIDIIRLLFSVGGLYKVCTKWSHVSLWSRWNRPWLQLWTNVHVLQVLLL